MMPKKIHYCWFGRGEKPELAKKCIESWKKFCPDPAFRAEMGKRGRLFAEQCFDQKKLFEVILQDRRKLLGE